MLPKPMIRCTTLIALAALAGSAHAQVRIDSDVRFTGASAPAAAIDLAAPVDSDAAIQVQGSLATGGYAWCSAIASADTVVLAGTPPLTAYADGTLLRFKTPVGILGQRFIKVDALPALPVRRTDGLPLSRGEILGGLVVDVMHVNGVFVALNASPRGCPPNTTQVHGNLCIDSAPIGGFLFKDAVDRCVDRGGKLCAWDEFIGACTLMGGQLQNLFTDWEWVDGSSNHSHGADQVGRLSCLSQRQVSPIPTATAAVRCCYRPR